MSENGEMKEATHAVPALESAVAKNVYTAPKLRHLGSVRDLTLGSAAGEVTDCSLPTRRVLDNCP